MNINTQASPSVSYQATRVTSFCPVCKKKVSYSTMTCPDPKCNGARILNAESFYIGLKCKCCGKPLISDADECPNPKCHHRYSREEKDSIREAERKRREIICS